MKNLTKKQVKEFVRIQKGLLLLNPSGEEFDDSNATLEDTKACYALRETQALQLLKTDEECQLASVHSILDYVRKNK